MGRKNSERLLQEAASDSKQMKLFSGVALRTGTGIGTGTGTPSAPSTPAAVAGTPTPVTGVDVATQCSIVSPQVPVVHQTLETPETQGITSDNDAILDELLGMIMDRIISTVEEKWQAMTRRWSKSKKLKEGILKEELGSTWQEASVPRAQSRLAKSAKRPWVSRDTMLAKNNGTTFNEWVRSHLDSKVTWM
jgi:hypothetical protein